MTVSDFLYPIMCQTSWRPINVRINNRIRNQKRWCNLDSWIGRLFVLGDRIRILKRWCNLDSWIRRLFILGAACELVVLNWFALFFVEELYHCVSCMVWQPILPTI